MFYLHVLQTFVGNTGSLKVKFTANDRGLSLNIIVVVLELCLVLNLFQHFLDISRWKYDLELKATRKI